MKIERIKSVISEIAKKIEAPDNLLPVYSINDFAIPYIEIDNEGNYNYVVRERGEEYERKIFKTDDELLFEVFINVTSLMATDYELQNRVENQDCRILIFSKKEDLLSLINQDWANKERVRHQELLKL